MKIFNFFKPKTLSRTEQIMITFSQEYLDKLEAEFRLVSAAYSNLTDINHNRFARHYGHGPVVAASSNLQIRRIELESMIEVLRDHLNG